MENELQSLEKCREACRALIQYIGRQPLSLENDEKVIGGWHWLRSLNENMGDQIKMLKAAAKEQLEKAEEPNAPEAPPSN